MIVPRSLPLRLIFLAVSILTAATLVLGQETFDVKAHYTKIEYMVPMRDGVKLFTIVYTPKDQSQKYPFLFFRTPYSVPPYGPDNYKAVLGPTREFDKEGFIFVFQDIRGKFRSEGEYILDRPIVPVKKNKSDVDEPGDIYDTLEWLLKNIPNHNGRVGQWGISAPGIQTTFGLINAHPAMKASSPQASPGDQFLGDDFHHNGAFRLMYVFSWLSSNARTRTSGPTEARVPPFDYGTRDGYRFFMELGPVSNVDKNYFQNRVPTWNEYMEHPNWDDYWEARSFFKYLKDVTPAVLNIAGWFDAEDFYGAMYVYYNIEKQNPGNKSTIVIGPWSHGQWNRSDGDSLGHIRFGAKTSLYFREKIQLPFFNYYLKDKGDLKLPEAMVFETGTNEWKSYDSWPPKSVTVKNLYFQPNGKLSFTQPSNQANNSDSYVSDPQKPVPFSAETRTTQGALWMIEDQRFASTRPDVLTYETDELTENITIAGSPIANLFASTTGTDADFIVKLIDVYPGNAPDNVPNPQGVRMSHFQMLLAGEVMRARFRNSFSKPEPFVPGRVTKVEFDLRDRYHTFLKGHRIMVQVQSTWFPVIDRNPQKFVDIYKAVDSDFQKATITVLRSPKYSSHVKLPVLVK